MNFSYNSKQTMVTIFFKEKLTSDMYFQVLIWFIISCAPLFVFCLLFHFNF